VHYTFEPTNPIPHLVVITGVQDGMVHYNDPAEEFGGGTLSVEKFKAAWKQKYIVIRPV
jgi:ABC-type bacteriocin/lantibiotic exporter with double-glycine peptidase domain